MIGFTNNKKGGGDTLDVLLIGFMALIFWSYLVFSFLLFVIKKEKQDGITSFINLVAFTFLIVLLVIRITSLT